VVGAGVPAGLVRDARLAQGTDPDQVAAGFGQEVTAEAEHVPPAAQADIARFSAEGPAGGDEPFRMSPLSAGVQVQGVGADTGGGVPSDLGALGGVLGEVTGDSQIADGAGQSDDADIDLGPPGDPPATGPGRMPGGVVADGFGGPPDGLIQVGDGEAGGRGQQPARAGGVVT